MKKLLVILVLIITLGGCTTETKTTKQDIKPEQKLEADKKLKPQAPMKVLPIRWQRLVVKEGKSCERCEATRKEVEKAFESLKESLVHLGIKVTLEEKALDPEAINHDISQSNRIWIGERSLEDWMGARVGQSSCGFCCAAMGEDVECRTIEVGGQTYETIPAEFVVRAGLQAASQLFVGRPLEPICETETPAELTPEFCSAVAESCSDEIIDGNTNEPGPETETTAPKPSEPCCPNEPGPETGTTTQKPTESCCPE